MKILKKLKTKKIELITGAFIGYGIFVRVQELGYANLQGDETNPLDYVYEDDFIYYLFNQKRGPLQYLINYINTSIFGFINEFQIRLPYLIFALLGMYLLYRIGKKIFDKDTALFATTLMAINGLFVAFARMEQYQSFLFFSLPLTAYLFIKHFEQKDTAKSEEKQKTNSKHEIRNPKCLEDLKIRILNLFRISNFEFRILKQNKYLLGSALLYAISLLAHYDALSLAAFFPLYVAALLLEREPTGFGGEGKPAAGKTQPRENPSGLSSLTRRVEELAGLGNAAVQKHIRNELKIRKMIKDASIFGLISLIPPGIFYAIMRFNPYYSKVTADYLDRRLFHGGFMPRIPDIMPIITIYIPPHYLLALIIMVTIGLIGLVGRVGEIKIPLPKISKPGKERPPQEKPAQGKTRPDKSGRLGNWAGWGIGWSAKEKKFIFGKNLTKAGYILLCLIFGGATVFSRYPIKPRSSTLLVCGASVGITLILLLSKKIKPKVLALLGWFFLPYCTYFFLMRDPRTHVYTAFIPGFIVAGCGVTWLINQAKVPNLKSQITNKIQITNLKPQTESVCYLVLKKLMLIWNLVLGTWNFFNRHLLKPLTLITFSLLLLFESGFLWQGFVDKTPEHPWQEKYLLGWKLYDVDHVFHARPEGVFGVPYYRGWERFGAAIKEDCLRGSFFSNEEDSISYYYARKHQDEKAKYEADNLIIVEGPHSWRFIDEDDRLQPEYLKKEGYVLLKTTKSNHGLPVMWVWGKEELYPEGKPFCEF